MNFVKFALFLPTTYGTIDLLVIKRIFRSSQLVYKSIVNLRDSANFTRVKEKCGVEKKTIAKIGKAKT